MKYDSGDDLAMYRLLSRWLFEPIVLFLLGTNPFFIPDNSTIYFSLSNAATSSCLNMKYTLVLVRHGESTWNDENRFTGWYDCPLSEKGLGEAHAGAKLLKDAGYSFDIAYTSTLQRAIKTLRYLHVQTQPQSVTNFQMYISQHKPPGVFRQRMLLLNLSQ